MGSPLLASIRFVTPGAFVGTNPADEPITSGLPVIQTKSRHGAPERPFPDRENCHGVLLQ
jgi:hypothetical protein